MRRIAICGNGGHAASVAAACNATGISCERLDDKDVTAERIAGFPSPALVITGTGDRYRRRELQSLFRDCDVVQTSVIHPTAFVDPSAKIAEGVFVGAFAYVGPSSHVETGAIINTRAMVEHGSHVDVGAHIAVGAILCGNVHIGQFTDVFASATVLPGVRVGDDAVVGAGAVVTQDVWSGTKVVGIPAKPLRK